MNKNLLSDMGLFVEVVNQGSFSAAALQLRMPVSTLSRRIAALEKTLGLKLLHRTTRRVTPTAEGHAYHMRCHHLVQEALLAHEDLMGHHGQVKGTLRITCTPDMAHLHVPAALRELAILNADLKVELQLNSQRDDLHATGIDLALRVGVLESSDLVARHLGDLRQGLYASPTYLQQRSAPQTPQELVHHDCIRISARTATSIWTLQRHDVDQPASRAEISGRWVAGSPLVASALAIEHLGIAQVDRCVAEQFVHAGQLVAVLPGWEPVPVPVHAVTTSRLIPARVKVFLACLQRRFVA